MKKTIFISFLESDVCYNYDYLTMKISPVGIQAAKGIL